MPEPWQPLAVFFDFDGVLADTENIHVAAWERTFHALGWDISAETCARSFEEDDRAFLASVFASQKVINGDLNGWVARKQQLTRMMLADTSRLFPGASELVLELSRKKIAMAVVSSTWRENVMIVLGTTGLAQWFQLILGKEDLAQPKPHPAGYQLALDRLGVAPDQAVAIEDSAIGIRAANAAGVRSLAVGHGRVAGSWSGDARYLTDLRDTERTLRMIFNTGP